MKAVDFGQYIKQLRKEKKLTIRQLDMYSGVSHSYISQMERGERGVPKPDILKKLARPLGIEYEDLLIKAGYLEGEEGEKKVDNSTDITNDQAKNAAFEEYNRLPPHKRKLIDDMMKALLSDEK